MITFRSKFKPIISAFDVKTLLKPPHYYQPASLAGLVHILKLSLTTFPTSLSFWKTSRNDITYYQAIFPPARSFIPVAILLIKLFLYVLNSLLSPLLLLPRTKQHNRNYSDWRDFIKSNLSWNKLASTCEARRIFKRRRGRDPAPLLLGWIII